MLPIQSTNAALKISALLVALSLSIPHSTVNATEQTSASNSISLRFQKDIFGKSFELNDKGTKNRLQKTHKKNYIGNVANIMVDSVSKSRKAQRLAQKGESSAAALLSIQDGAEMAAPVSDDLYNTSIQGYLKVDKNTAFVRIPMKLFSLLKETNACDLGAVGPCIVVDKNEKGDAQAFMVGSANVDGEYHVVRKEIRKNIDNRRAMNELLKLENGIMTVYSFAQNQDDVNAKVSEAKQNVDKLAAQNQNTANTENQDVAENEVADEVSQVVPEKAIQVLTNDQDIEKAEKEMNALVGKWPEAMQKKYLELSRDARSGTCVVGGYLETKAIQLLFLRLDFTEKLKVVLPSNDRPLMKGKGKLLCYMNDKSVIRIQIEAKMFSDLSIGAMFGKMYFGSIGIGVANGPLDLLQTKQADGTLLPYREWAFFPFLNVDAAWIIGAGASLPGFSGGKFQSPILNLFTGRAAVGAVGARWGIFEKGRIGFDPDAL